MTLEDRAGNALLDYVHGRADVDLISFHPTSGKAYLTDIVRFQHRRDGVATPERDHVDMILVVGPLLLLVELKGKSGESSADVIKLRNLRDSYDVAELVKVIYRRLSVPGQGILGVQHLVICLGVVEHNATVPDDVAVFVTSEAGVRLACSGDLRDLLAPYFSDIIQAS